MNIKYQIAQLLLCLGILISAATLSNAQQLTHPMKFIVNTPASISGSYNYGYQAAGWGPTTINTTTGDLMWARGAAGDSLVCDTVVNDFTNKVAMVRRGTCSFVSKVYRAQVKGAIGCVVCNNAVNGGTINMGGTDPTVVIPAVFLSTNDCALIAARLDAGDSVSVTFLKPQLFNAIGKYAHQTPQSDIQPLTGMQMSVLNTSTATVPSSTVSLKITDPNGGSNTFTENVASLAPDSTRAVTFAGTYTPTVKGTYTMVYKTSMTASDSIVDYFVVSDTTHALDWSTALSSAGVSDADFATAGYSIDNGATYISGLNGTTVTGVSYAIANPGPFLGKTFTVLMYEIPTTATGAETDYSTFNVIAAGIDTITEADTLAPNVLQYVHLQDLINFTDTVPLLADRQYMVVVRFIGDASTPVCPRITTGGSGTRYLSFAGSVNIPGDRLYMAGWATAVMPLIRMYTKNTVVSAVTPQPMELNNVDVFPNPASGQVNVKVCFDEATDNVNVRLIDIKGRVLSSNLYNNVQNETFNYNVSELPAGVYFIRVDAGNYYRTRQLIIR